MPWSDRLGMFVRSPEEGVQEGQYAGNIFAHAADQGAAQYQQSLENKLKAAATLKRTMALREMADRIDEYMDIPGVTETDAQKRAFFDVAPQLFHDNPQALFGVYKAEEQEKRDVEELRLRTAEQQKHIALYDAQIAKANRDSTSYPKSVQDALGRARLEQETSAMGGGQAPPILQPRQPVLQPNQTEPAQEPPSFPGMYQAQAPDLTAAPSPAPAQVQPAVNPQLAINQRALELLNKGKDKSVTEKEIDAQLADEEAIAVSKGSAPWTEAHRTERRAELRTMKSFKPGLSATLSYDDQGRPILNLGEGQATVGTQTAIQTQLANIKNSVVQIDRAKNVLTEKDLGVPGNIWDQFVNRWITQVVPGAADPSVSANRAQLQKAIDSYLETEQSRGRLSSSERQAVRQTLVTQNLGESLPRAQSVLDAMSRMQKADAISRAKSGKQPLQDWMFNGLSQTEIKQMFREGILDQNEAINWGLKAVKR